MSLKKFMQNSVCDWSNINKYEQNTERKKNPVTFCIINKVQSDL